MITEIAVAIINDDSTNAIDNITFAERNAEC